MCGPNAGFQIWSHEWNKADHESVSFKPEALAVVNASLSAALS